ncbi:Gfo/Idh/MocA family oxidoreductase [Paenibacillus sp. CC-CFT747]|nr:Gfo/Idh/MocA family oxidoreductase [Paenibacillus sp. CC-CFT747]
MVRIAIVGTGWQGQGLMSSLKQIEGMELVGACDLNAEMLAKVVTKFSVPGYADYGRMLDETKPDGVLICIHPQHRYELVKEAAVRGIPCFIEKPPARDLEGARRISDVLEEYGVMNSVGFMYRYSAALQKAKELIAGRRVALVRSCMLDGLAIRPDSPRWFFDKERSGGPVFDQAIHVLDLSRYLFGDVEAASGFQGNRTVPKGEDFTVEDSASLTLRYRNGIMQSHTHSWAYNGFRMQLEIVSDELDLTLDLGKGTLTGTAGGEPVAYESQDALYRLELEAFGRAIREEIPLGSGPPTRTASARWPSLYQPCRRSKTGR